MLYFLWSTNWGSNKIGVTQGVDIFVNEGSETWLWNTTFVAHR